MYVTKFTVLRGDRGRTDVTPYDILEGLGVHGQASGQFIVTEAEKSSTTKTSYTVYQINKDRGVSLLEIELYRSRSRVIPLVRASRNAISDTFKRVALRTI